MRKSIEAEGGLGAKPESNLYLEMLERIEEIKPLRIEKCEGRYPPYLGFNPDYDDESLFTLVTQGGAESEQDIPLYSSGFGICHADLIYNEENCKASLLHAEHHELRSNQVQELEKLSREGGENEIILVFGEISNNPSVQEIELLKKAKCVVRKIKAPTGKVNWGISYDPRNNEIVVDCVERNEVRIYPGFSEKIYNNERRDRHDLAKRKEKIEIKAVKKLLMIRRILST